MNIEAKKGSRVKYLGCTEEQVKYMRHDDPRELLIIGNTYTVDHTEVHDFYTRVYLAEFPDKDFNSVCFEDEKNLIKELGAVIEALKTDKDYRYGWQANIAMSISDAIHNKKKKLVKKVLNRKELHEACNEGADNFLTLLCN